MPESPTPEVRTTPRVMVIRHGEKPHPAQGDAPEQHGVDAHGEPSPRGLTPRGWSRAGALAVRFDRAGGPEDTWIRPERVHAAPATHDNHSHRCLDTAHPIAARLDLGVHHHHARGDEEALVTEVLDSGEHTLIVWDHGHIPDLLRAFDVINPDDIPDPWPGHRFDLIAQLDPDPHTGRYRVGIDVQDLLSGDAPTP